MICYSNNYILYSSRGFLFAKSRNGSDYDRIGRIPIPIFQTVFSGFRLLSRFARMQPRCGVFINETNALISFHGTIYSVNLKDKTIQKEHSFRKGMSSPLTFSKIEKISGFDDCIAYGDYINDGKENEISIYTRSFHSSDWKKAYSFPKGAIKHIHALILCRQRNSVLILTGDNDAESGIWEATDHFSHMRKIVGGKQIYRACVALPLEHGIIYATDAPNENNALWYCDYEGNNTKKVSDISGPCIYGVHLTGNRMLFSTSVEPSSINTGLSSWISYKRGKGVQDGFSHVYMLNNDMTVSEVYRCHKDILPMRLFGFGTFLFPSGTGNELYIVGQAVSGMDGKTLQLIDL